MDEIARGIAIHPVTGDVYAAGTTNSTDLPRTTAGEQPNFGGNGSDGFITRINTGLTSLIRSTYLGGSGNDIINAIAIHPLTGDVYVTGTTASTNFPKVGVSEQVAKGSGTDAFVSRFTPDLLALDAVPNAFSFASRLNVPAGSLQTSGAAQITGIAGNVPVFITGGNFAEYCISSSGCTCNVQAFTRAGATVNDTQSVCVRQIAPFGTPALARTTLTVGGVAASFVVTTGAEISGSGCTLDVDGNGGIDALTDGLMLLRAMFGLTGTAVTSNAIGGGAPSRTTWA